jgi:hypothetical protein
MSAITNHASSLTFMLAISVTGSRIPDFLDGSALMRNSLLIAGLIVPGLLAATEPETKNSSLPEIKATIRFHSASHGNVPDEIELPASTLLEAKQRRVIEGDLGRLPIRIYIRETPNQPRPTIEVNVVNIRTNQSLAGYPMQQEVGPLGMLSFNISITSTELETLVRKAKKSAEGKLGKVDSISLHVDIDIPVNLETSAAGDLVLDCDDLLRQDDQVVDDLTQKTNDTSNAGIRSVAAVYTGCLDKQTDALTSQLKPDDKKTVDRIRELLADLPPVGFDSAINSNGGTYFTMLTLAGVSVDSKQAETANRIARELGQSSVSNPGARKAVATAFAACQTTLKKLVAAPVNADEETDTGRLKKQFQSDLDKAQTALKELQQIAAKLPDNAAAFLAEASLSILATAPEFE